MNIFDHIKAYVSEKPWLFGVFFIAIGLFFLLASIFNWKIIFGDVSKATYSLKKLDGIINMFGPKTARIVFGLSSFLVMGFGVLWIYASMRGLTGR